jgi:hypothetical protein
LPHIPTRQKGDFLSSRHPEREYIILWMGGELQGTVARSGHSPDIKIAALLSVKGDGLPIRGPDRPSILSCPQCHRLWVAPVDGNGPNLGKSVLHGRKGDPLPVRSPSRRSVQSLSRHNRFVGTSVRGDHRDISLHRRVSDSLPVGRPGRNASKRRRVGQHHGLAGLDRGWTASFIGGKVDPA